MNLEQWTNHEQADYFHVRLLIYELFMGGVPRWALWGDLNVRDGDIHGLVKSNPVGIGLFTDEE